MFVPLGVIVGGRGWGVYWQGLWALLCRGGRVKPSGGVAPRGAGIGGVNL